MNENSDLEEYAPWFVLGITLAGGALRVLLLRTKGMWLDETFSVWMASQSIPDMLTWIVRIDQHPPLYYLLLHAWMSLGGESAYAVRLLSTLFGAGTIPIVYLIGKRMSGVMVGLGAAVLLALSPFHIYFAQEARMYTLLTFNAAAAMYALVWLLTDPRADTPMGSQLREYVRARGSGGSAAPEHAEEFSYKPVRPRSGWRAWIDRHRLPPIETIETDLAWTGLIFFSAAAMFSHNTAVLFPLAVNIFVLGLMLFERVNPAGVNPALRAPSPANWAKAQIGTLILWSAWIPAFIRQAGAVSRRFWVPAPTWETVLQTFKLFLNASAPMPDGQARLVWGLYALALCLGVLSFRKKFSQFVFLAVLFAIPILGELIVSIHRPIFWDRTLIWTTIPLFLVLAAGAAQLRYRTLVFCVVGIFGTINLFSAGDYLRFYQKEDWHTPAGYVSRFSENGDLVLFNSNFTVIPFEYYFKDYEELYSIEVEKRGVPLDLFEDGVLEPEMTGGDIPGLIRLLEGHARVWLVYSHESYTDPSGLVPQTLASQKELVQEREFHGGRVQLYADP